MPGETWDDSLRRVALSLREMTLRHPRAFPLVAAAPVFESPVLEYAARIRALHEPQGISQEQFVGMWSVCDAFLTGFMVMLAQAAIRAEEAARPLPRLATPRRNQTRGRAQRRALRGGVPPRPRGRPRRPARLRPLRRRA